MTVVLTLPYPISANRYWATRVVTSAGKRPMAMTYVTPEAKSFKADVLRIARATGITAPITGRVKLEIWLYPSRPQDWERRVRKLGANWDDGVMSIDLDNANKVVLDALKEVAFDDDKWVRQLLAQRMEPDGKGARAVIRITAIPAAQPQPSLI